MSTYSGREFHELSAHDKEKVNQGIIEKDWEPPADFTFVYCERPIKGGMEPAMQVCWKGEAIALFRGDDLFDRGREYVGTYGYMAEWRRLRNIAAVADKQEVSWSEDLRVYID